MKGNEQFQNATLPEATQVSREDFASREEFMEEVDTYAWYLNYKVERSLYEIVKKGMPGLTWDRFVQIIQYSGELGDIAKHVLTKTVQDFLDKGTYDFTATQVQLLNDSDEQDSVNGQMMAADLFSGKELGRKLIMTIFRNTMEAFARERLALKKDKKVEASRMLTVMRKNERESVEALLHGTRNALSQLDFTPAWLAQGEEYLLQTVKQTDSVIKGLKHQIPISELPFDFKSVKDKYGEISAAQELCPGVYYIATKFSADKLRFPEEYLVVMEDSPVISPEARAFTTPLATDPNVFICVYEYGCKGRHVVEYEVCKYLLEHGIPLPEGESLEDARAFGMEVCPEYFGEFPVPEETPWGAPIQVDRVGNGVFWLKTERAGWVLALAYPIYDDINEEVLALSAPAQAVRTDGAGSTPGCRFFLHRNSCLPLFELLMFTNPAWAGKFSVLAIKNAVLRSFPDYAAKYNRDAAPGEQIIFAPEAGTDFYPLPE